MRFQHILSIACLAWLLPMAAQQPSSPRVKLKVVVADTKITGEPWDGPNGVALGVAAVAAHKDGLLFAKFESKADPVAAFLELDGKADVRFAPGKKNFLGYPMSPCQDLGACEFEFSPDRPMGVLLFDADLAGEQDWIEAFVLTPSLERITDEQAERLAQAILATARRLNVTPLPVAEKIPVLQVSELSGSNVVDLPQASVAIRPILSRMESARQREQSGSDEKTNDKGAKK
jgi:hypothetical protein